MLALQFATATANLASQKKHENWTVGRQEEDSEGILGGQIRGGGCEL